MTTQEIPQTTTVLSKPIEATPPAPAAIGLRVAVIVCAFSDQRFEQTRRCINELLAGSRIPDELVLVIDNNDALLARFCEVLPREVRIMANRGKGLSDGRNTGVDATASDIVAFVDDDAWPDKHWLKALAASFEDERVLGAGGRIEPDWEDASCALPEELYWIVGSTYRGHRTDAGPITRPIGANMAVRRSTLQHLGGFSPRFGRRGGAKDSSNEELAFFATVAEQFGGERIWYAPESVVHHFAPMQRCTSSYLIRRSRIEGRSKADIARIYGKSAMHHDRSYVTSTLRPALTRYCWRAVRSLERESARFAVQLLAAFAITATSYVGRRMSHALRPQRPSIAKGGSSR